MASRPKPSTSATKPAKKVAAQVNAQAAASAGAPAAGGGHIGMVIRFERGGSAPGLRSLERQGFRVASSTDFKKVAAVTNNVGGADIQYFAHFGLAVVRGQIDKLPSAMRATRATTDNAAVRPERRYVTLGQPVDRTAIQAPALLMDRLEALVSRRGGADYWQGFRDAVNLLVPPRASDALKPEDFEMWRKMPGREPSPAKAKAERHTWGLMATRAHVSKWSGKGIRIAVLDTGFDHTHPDFVGRKVVRKRFASRSSDKDLNGHGTHCVGVACGPRQPSQGPRYGVAYEAEIYAGKVFGDDDLATDRSIFAGLDWAVDNKCHIISMSLGSSTYLGEEVLDDYEHIGRVCLEHGILPIAAAGNDSQRPGYIAPVHAPANAPSVMAVAAVDSDLHVAGFSCGGLNPGQDVDLAAPGVDILSSVPGGYARWNGTSMATPHVAGIAALIAQSNAKYRGLELWSRLISSSKRLPEPAADVGRGLVQAPLR